MQELITAYLSRIADLYGALNDDETQAIWQNITDEVNSIRRRKVTPNAARNKINTLRTLFELNDEKSLGPIFDQVKTMVDTERLYGPREKPSKRRRKRKRHESRDEKQGDNIPSWYAKYSEDANRRHSEKIAIHLSMIEVLEKVLASK